MNLFGPGSRALCGEIVMYILSMRYGRLCNRLFNAAHILALAIENKHTFVNLAFYEYAEHFRTTQNDIFCRYPAKNGLVKSNKIIAMLLYYPVYHFATFLYYLSKIGINTRWLGLYTIRPQGGKDKIVLNLDGDTSSLPMDLSDISRTVFFQGWELRAFACLRKHGDKVRDYFKPTEEYLSDINAFITEHREGCDVLIGIVIRHGNYRKWQNGKYFYPLDTYVNVMKQLTQQLRGKKIKFLIFSDDEQDTSVFKSADMDFFFRSGHMIENLYSLAECDYIVSAPSTYGMWGSFYGKTPLYVIYDPDQIISISDSFAVYEG